MCRRLLIGRHAERRKIVLPNLVHGAETRDALDVAEALGLLD